MEEERQKKPTDGRSVATEVQMTQLYQFWYQRQTQPIS